MKKEILKNGTAIMTSSGFRVDSDGPLLASFIEYTGRKRLLDLCTGNGIIPVWLRDRGFEGEIVAVDIQPQAVGLLETAIKLNHMENISAVRGDLRDYTSPVKFDLISCNPPYYDINASPASPDETRRISRSSACASVSDAAISASRNLGPRGRFYCCFPPSGMERLFSALSAASLHPRRIRFARHTEQSPPWLLLIEAGLTGKDSLVVMPDLIAVNNGVRNAEFDEIFSMGVCDAGE